MVVVGIGGKGGGTSCKQSPMRSSLHQSGLPLGSFGLLRAPIVTSSRIKTPSMAGLQWLNAARD